MYTLKWSINQYQYQISAAYTHKEVLICGSLARQSTCTPHKAADQQVEHFTPEFENQVYFCVLYLKRYEETYKSWQQQMWTPLQPGKAYLSLSIIIVTVTKGYSVYIKYCSDKGEKNHGNSKNNTNVEFRIQG
jgi:hypothetical protein